MKYLVLLLIITANIFSQVQQIDAPKGIYTTGLIVTDQAMILRSLGSIYFSNDINGQWYTAINNKALDIEGIKFPFIISQSAYIQDEFGSGIIQVNNLGEVILSNDLGTSWIDLAIVYGDFPLRNLFTSSNGRVFAQFANGTDGGSFLCEVIRTDTYSCDVQLIMDLGTTSAQQIIANDEQLLFNTSTKLYSYNGESIVEMELPTNTSITYELINDELYLIYFNDEQINVASADISENSFQFITQRNAANWPEIFSTVLDGKILFASRANPLLSFDPSTSSISVQNMTLPFNLLGLETFKDDLIAISPAGIVYSEDQGLWWEQSFEGMSSMVPLFPWRNDNVMISSGIYGDLQIKRSDQWQLANFNSSVLPTSFLFQVAAASNGNLITTGLQGPVVSQDNGNNWTYSQLSAASGQFRYYPCYHRDPDGRLLMYFGEFIFVSTDEGLTWRRSLQVTVNIYDISDADNDEYLVAAEGGLFRTDLVNGATLIDFEGSRVIRAELVNNTIVALVTTNNITKIIRKDLSSNEVFELDIEMTYDLTNVLYSFEIDDHGNVIYVNWRSLRSYLLSFNSEQLKEIQIDYDYIFSVNKTEDGEILLGGLYGDIYLFDSTTGIFTTKDENASILSYLASSSIVKVKEDIRSYSIYDLNGSLKLSGASQEIDINDLTKGVYLLKVELVNGHSRIEKFIK